MADNYTIDYNDERFQNVAAEQAQKEAELSNTYDNMINESDSYYQKQIDAANDYAKTQQDLQNQQTDLAINEIEQEKEQAQKDYLKEQKGAYADYTKESNKYGANAETMASNGLQNTGYSESSKVSMYNTYQNRVATAKESYDKAILSYNNSIAEARLSNSSALAEIAYNALQNQLELSLNGFQYKNQLLTDKTNALQTLNNTYYSRWQDVLSQMNTENSLAESIRQYNENMAYQKERDKVSDEQWQKEYNLSKKAASSSSGGSVGATWTDSGIDVGTTTNNNTTTSKTSSSSGTSFWTKTANAVKNVVSTAKYNSLSNDYAKTLYDNISSGSYTSAQINQVASYAYNNKKISASDIKILQTLAK